MPNYKETSVTGSSYVRAREVVIRNELDGIKGASFIEELVINLDGQQLKQPADGFFKELTAENAATTFPVLDAEGTPTGATATYFDVYALLSSLYYHLATERDNANQAQ